MAGELFRERVDEEAPVTSAELFFDLVFVFAVTQASHFLLHHLDWMGALEAAFLLLAVWSAWVDTVLITNLLDPTRQMVRVALFVLMAVGLFLASALPEAFNDGGLVFATAFAIFQLGRTIFVAWAARGRPAYFGHFLRTGIWVVIYASFWIAGGLIEGNLRFAFWAIALLLDYLAPAFGYPVPGIGRSDNSELNIEGGHVAERIGLFVMIALGESVLVTGATFAELPWTPEVVVAMASSLLCSMAMWWIYFYWSSDLAKSVISRARDPARFIIRAFGYVPWVVVAGIVITAVGDDLVLAEPNEPVSMQIAWVLIGGPALFLLGATLFEYGAFGKWSRLRLIAAGLTIALVLIVPFVTALMLSIASTLIMISVAVLEHIWFNQRQTMLQLRMIELGEPKS